MKHLNQHMKQDPKSLEFAIGILGSINAYRGSSTPISRRAIQGNIREINDKFTMEETLKMRDIVLEAGFELSKKLKCSEWFKLHKDLKKYYKSHKVLHREHVAGGIKEMCHHLLVNYMEFKTAQDVLDYIVDNTSFVARCITEVELNENTTLDELQKYTK